jgi:TPR repeat protein
MRYEDPTLDFPIWQLVDQSDCAEDFRNYLRQFGQGRFRNEALDRLVALNDNDEAGTPRWGSARELIRTQAEAGNRNAQFHYGKALDHGIGVDKDRAAAERWYRLAIRQGELRAHINLCQNLLDARPGDSPDQDSEAMALADAAATAGEANGTTLLAQELLRASAPDRDVAGAIEMLEQALAGGDGRAGSELARLFLYDRTVRPNAKAAADYAQRAALLGEGSACYLMGFFLEREAKGVDGLEAARDWYARGAALLDPACFRSIGFMLLRGNPPPKDGAAGVAHLKRAAALGDGEAMRGLGLTYFHGIDVVPNGTCAVRWFRRALAAGEVVAAEYLARCHARGFGVEADEAAALAHAETAARAGLASAQTQLASLLLAPRQRDRDPIAAARWLTLARLQNDMRATAMLGHLLATGDGVEPNLERAEALYRQAAEAGDLLGQEYLGAHLLAQRDAHFDPAETAFWLDTAASRGSSHAPFLIGIMFQQGFGVERNAGEAARWFLVAAERGHGGAMFELGKAYLDGEGVAADREEAKRWLEAASANGTDEADPLLDRAKLRLASANPEVPPPAATPVETDETLRVLPFRTRPADLLPGEAS